MRRACEMGRWSRSSPARVAAETGQSGGGPPTLILPQLATLADGPPNSGDWSYEIKVDGYRLMTRIDLQVDNAWLDGEAVVLDSSGRPDFNALQNAFDRRSTAQIVMFAFDLLWLNDTDLREQPLRVRRALLRDLMHESVP